MFGLHTWERGRPARILFLPRRPPAPVPQGYRRFRQPAVRRLAAAELQCNSAGSHLVGGYRISQAEGEVVPFPFIEVAEIGVAVSGLVRAGRPRSQEVVIS